MPKLTSVRLSDELSAQLDQLAGSLDRPRSWVIEQALSRYVEEEAQQIAAIADAFASYQRGEAELIPHEEVMEELKGQLGAS